MVLVKRDVFIGTRVFLCYGLLIEASFSEYQSKATIRIITVSQQSTQYKTNELFIIFIAHKIGFKR